MKLTFFEWEIVVMEWDPHETLSFQDHILLIYIQCILEFCSFGIDFEQDFELKIFANKHNYHDKI